MAGECFQCSGDTISRIFYAVLNAILHVSLRASHMTS